MGFSTNAVTDFRPILGRNCLGGLFTVWGGILLLKDNAMLIGSQKTEQRVGGRGDVWVGCWVGCCDRRFAGVGQGYRTRFSANSGGTTEAEIHCISATAVNRAGCLQDVCYVLDVCNLRSRGYRFSRCPVTREQLERC